VRSFTPFLTVFIALLLVSKIPTPSLKKISISSKATIFLLLVAGLIFIALLFYTFETLLLFGLLYLSSIPLSIFIFYNQKKKKLTKISDEDHEDIL
jgi:phosphatidylserine synthase